jgi:hypothetical protein
VISHSTYDDLPKKQKLMGGWKLDEQRAKWNNKMFVISHKTWWWWPSSKEGLGGWKMDGQRAYNKTKKTVISYYMGDELPKKR